MQRKKPAKLVWTQAWRRLNKKGATDAVIKKRARRTNKVARAVVGLSLDDIRKRATQKSEVRSAQRDAALKEVKARKTANKSKSGKKSVQGGGQVNKVPKNVKRAQKGASQRRFGDCRANKSKSGKKSVQGGGQVNKVPKNVKRAQKGASQR
eukprot:CAMPEP_0178592608 /NCGR_PEP_ID=MMETSP0697-20121206/29467_1 /TAXON_ID=265572 /ORGANISM="Extubocellulus spinifer, Strain CCMP396" /LENGTH=151 /DNA_ID=CAMNT_0020229655 /DNA_START=356 /DNA_END=812 /DNA_ORIENTATION=+